MTRVPLFEQAGKPRRIKLRYLTLTSRVRSLCVGTLEASAFLERVVRGEVGRSLLPLVPLMRGAELNVWKSQYIAERENLARKEGRDEGRLLATRSALLELLQARFPNVAGEWGDMVEAIGHLSALTQCLRTAVTAATVDEVRSQLQQAAQKNGSPTPQGG